MGVIRKLLFRMKKAVAYLTLSTTSTSATWSPATITNTGATLTWDVSGDITPTSQNVDDPTFDLSANLGTVNMSVYDVNKLEGIYLDSLSISLIDVTNCQSLVNLVSNFNQLTSLDTSSNISLVNLQLYDNLISSLDLSLNTTLVNLQCGNNLLTSLNVSSNTLLNTIYCISNTITSLNTTNNTSLTNLWCFFNTIPSLDLSTNTLLIDVRCHSNNMSSIATDQIYIDLANGVGINGQLHIRNNRTSASDTARATLISRGWTFDETFTT